MPEEWLNKWIMVHMLNASLGVPNPFTGRLVSCGLKFIVVSFHTLSIAIPLEQVSCVVLVLNQDAISIESMDIATKIKEELT